MQIKKTSSSLIIVTFLFCHFCSFSQNNSVDSLKLALKNAKHDSTRLRLRLEIGESALIFRVGYWDSITIEAKKLKLIKIEATALDDKGNVYYNQGDFTKAFDCFKQSLALHKIIDNKKGIANASNDLGAVYEYQGDIPTAIIYYAQSLKINEELKDKFGTSNSLNNIGLLYYTQGDKNKALEYFNKSYSIQQSIGDKSGMSSSLNNIGLIYSNNADILIAMEYYKKSLKLNEETGDNAGVAKLLNNIGALYWKKSDFKNAMDNFEKSLLISKKYGYKAISTTSLKHIGEVYYSLSKEEHSQTRKKEKLILAYEYASKSLLLSIELGSPRNISYSENLISRIDSTNGNYKEAFEHYKQYIIYNDSIGNIQTRKASTRSQLKYEFEKKEAVMIEQQEKERSVSEANNQFQQIVIGSVVFGLLLVLVFAIFVVRSLKTTKNQKIIIEEKQREILGSIQYAKRIQTSLLPTDIYIEKNIRRLKDKKNE